jgi:hypothetical protein
MRKTIKCLTFIFLALSACKRGQIKTANNIMGKFEEFKRKEKFNPHTLTHHPGIENADLIPVLSEKLNLSADDFKKVFESGNATDKGYQDKIQTGLQRFNDVYANLDTEDRERICYYYEELWTL